MCMLSYIPAGVELTDDGVRSLENGGEWNRDGYGWAIVTDAGIILRRTLSLDEALDSFIEYRLEHLGAALFHSRWTTHGASTVGNCHPWIVGTDYRTVLAHNGVIQHCTPAHGDRRSDTGVFAQDIVPRQFRRLDKPSVRNALARYIGTRNKVLILTSNPRYRQNAYLFNESAGQWDGDTGMWHSNGDYLYGMRQYRGLVTYPNAVTETPDDTVPHLFDDICGWCDGEVNALAHCTSCGICQDCCETVGDCLCFYAKESALYETGE